MKELEEQLHGCYSPSPGTVYPTLQWLEDGGLVVARDVEGKKVYEITDAGRKFLEEHRDVVDDIFECVRDTVDRALGGAMADVNRAVGRLMRAVYRAGWRARDDATRQRLGGILPKNPPPGESPPGSKKRAPLSPKGARPQPGGRWALCP